jgi:hypothetical protein
LLIDSSAHVVEVFGYQFTGCEVNSYGGGVSFRLFQKWGDQFLCFCLFEKNRANGYGNDVFCEGGVSGDALKRCLSWSVRERVYIGEEKVGCLDGNGFELEKENERENEWEKEWANEINQEKRRNLWHPSNTTVGWQKI